MDIYTINKEHPLWEQTIAYAAGCSWRAGPFLAERMKNRDFLDWERVMVAVEGRDIVGFAAFCETGGLPEAYTCTPFINYVFVDEGCRGQRLSQRLIAHTLAYAKELGYQTVYLKSEHRGLYEKYGFEKLGEFVPIQGPADQLFKIEL